MRVNMHPNLRGFQNQQCWVKKTAGPPAILYNIFYKFKFFTLSKNDGDISLTTSIFDSHRIYS